VSFRPDERFAIVPEWVLDLPVSDRAIRLYCTLGLYADYNSGHCNPGRKRLAARLGNCSVDSVDRAKKELVQHDAITVLPNTAPAGDPTTNVYIVHRLPPGSRRTATTSQACNDGGRTSAAQTRTSTNDRSSSSRKSWPPKSIDGVPVTKQEVSVAEKTLSTFNDTFDKNFRAADFLKKIVQRHREHPDADLDAVIEKAAGNRWWERRGGNDFSPNVVFGNAKIFERTLNFEAGARGGGPDLSAYR
jgi:hypothetical protein